MAKIRLVLTDEEAKENFPVLGKVPKLSLSKKKPPKKGKNLYKKQLNQFRRLLR